MSFAFAYVFAASAASAASKASPHPSREEAALRAASGRLRQPLLLGSAQSYIFRPQLAKRIQQSRTCAPCRGKQLTNKRTLEKLV